MGKIVLHIVNDDKFIDGLITSVDSYACTEIKNFFVNVNQQNFQYIKNTERLTLVERGKFIEFLNTIEADAVVLHSLHVLLRQQQQSFRPMALLKSGSLF